MMLEPGENFRSCRAPGPAACRDGLSPALLPQGGAIVHGATASVTPVADETHRADGQPDAATRLRQATARGGMKKEIRPRQGAEAHRP